MIKLNISFTPKRSSFLEKVKAAFTASATKKTSDCGCAGEEIHEVTVQDSFEGPPVSKRLCMYHIENETYHGKIVTIK